VVILSMGQLIYLLDEICTGIEIYYSGRIGGQYLKTAFILCDDYTELVSKLFLLEDNREWSDVKRDQRFKNYHDVLNDVNDVFNKKRVDDLQKFLTLHGKMIARRKRRNDFFHSTHLLDMNVIQRNCVEAFCDLLEYGELLFCDEWRTELESCRDLGTFEVLLRLEKRSFGSTTIMPKVNDILKTWPRREKEKYVRTKGTQYAEYPEDLHLRLCVTWGGRELRDKLKGILNSPD